MTEVARTDREKARGRKRAQRAFPATTCEECGGTRHLSRHHRDENPLNNDPANIAILCGRCHQLLELARRRPTTAPSTETCVRGHPRTAENTYVDPLGYRQCRVCAREAARRRLGITPDRYRKP